MSLDTHIESHRIWLLPAFVVSTLKTVGQFGVHPDDSAEIRLQKAILTNVLVFGGIPAQLALTIFALVFGEWAMFWVIAIDLVLAIGGVLYLGFTRKHFAAVKFMQMSLPLLAPFTCLLLTGGLVNIAFSLIWGIVSPMLSLVLYPPRQALVWLLAFLGLVVVGFVVQPYLRPITSFPSEAIWMIGYANLFGFSIMVFTAVAILLHQRNVAHRLLEAERKKSERLLHNVLPVEIASILRENSTVIADQMECASVLFADVVGFTPLSARLSAAELVELLNEVFSFVDALADKHGLEKIKTIGDCYMVAAGVPRPRADHAQALALMAIELRDALQHRQFRGHQLQFRIGMNSGPLVAGVIGRKKFIYDLWGDTVNTASRMESHGQGNRIQISQASYELLRDDFVCESLGEANIKGKGLMPVWELIGRQTRQRTVESPAAREGCQIHSPG